VNLATVAGVIICTCGVLIISMAGLIKSMVLGRLDQMMSQLVGMDDRLNQHDGRIIRLEEWRENTRTDGALGRRATDHCAIPDCPCESRR
jgi:hypothetical protein